MICFISNDSLKTLFFITVYKSLHTSSEPLARDLFISGMVIFMLKFSIILGMLYTSGDWRSTSHFYTIFRL